MAVNDTKPDETGLVRNAQLTKARSHLSRQLRRSLNARKLHTTQQHLWISIIDLMLGDYQSSAAELSLIKTTDHHGKDASYVITLRLTHACLSAEYSKGADAQRILEDAIELSEISVEHVMDLDIFTIFVFFKATLELAVLLNVDTEQRRLILFAENIVKMQEPVNPTYALLLKTYLLDIKIRFAEGASKNDIFSDQLILLNTLRSESADEAWLYNTEIRALLRYLGEVLPSTTDAVRSGLTDTYRLQARENLQKVEALVASPPAQLSAAIVTAHRSALAYLESIYNSAVREQTRALQQADVSRAWAIKAALLNPESHRSLRNLVFSLQNFAQLTLMQYKLTGEIQIDVVDSAFSAASNCGRRLVQIDQDGFSGKFTLWRIEREWADLPRGQTEGELRVELILQSIITAGSALASLARLDSSMFDTLSGQLSDYIINSAFNCVLLTRRLAIQRRVLKSVSDMVDDPLWSRPAVANASKTWLNLSHLTGAWSLNSSHRKIPERPAWPRLSKDRYIASRSLKRSWPCAPLISTVWRVLSFEQADAALSALMTALALPSDISDPRQDYVVEQMITSRLHFYKDWQLCEVVFRNSVDERRTLDFIVDVNRYLCVVLDGASVWFHLINNLEGIHLASEKDAYSYAVLFCSALRGESRSRFCVVESWRTLLSYGASTASDLLPDAPGSQGELTETGYRFTFMILYASRLFQSQVEVDRDGDVRMLTDEPVLDDVGLVEETFEGPWRVCRNGLGEDVVAT